MRHRQSKGCRKHIHLAQQCDTFRETVNLMGHDSESLGGVNVFEPVIQIKDFIRRPLQMTERCFEKAGGWFIRTDFIGKCALGTEQHWRQ